MRETQMEKRALSAIHVDVECFEVHHYTPDILIHDLPGRSFLKAPPLPIREDYIYATLCIPLLHLCRLIDAWIVREVGADDSGMTRDVVHLVLSHERAGIRDDFSLLLQRQNHGESLNKHPARHLFQACA